MVKVMSIYGSGQQVYIFTLRTAGVSVKKQHRKLSVKHRNVHRNNGQGMDTVVTSVTVCIFQTAWLSDVSGSVQRVVALLSREILEWLIQPLCVTPC